MVCQKCSRQNLIDSQYCAGCGMPLEQIENSQNSILVDSGRQRITPTYEDGNSGGFARNILLSFMIHGIVTLATFAWFATLLLLSANLYPIGILLVIFAVFFGIPMMIGLYVFLGYRCLIFLPRFNLHSLSALTLVLTILSFASASIGSAHILSDWILLLPNLPMLFVVVLVDNFVNHTPPNQPAPFAWILAAAFLPSILMYCGLQLRFLRKTGEIAGIATSPEQIRDMQVNEQLSFSKRYHALQKVKKYDYSTEKVSTYEEPFIFEDSISRENYE